MSNGVWGYRSAGSIRPPAGRLAHLLAAVIGRGHRLLLLERLIEYGQRHEGGRFAMLAGEAEAFRAAEPKGGP